MNILKDYKSYLENISQEQLEDDLLFWNDFLYDAENIKLITTEIRKRKLYKLMFNN